jgi:hypothetical protein
MLRDRSKLAVNRLGLNRERLEMDMTRFVRPAPPLRAGGVAASEAEQRQGSLF